MAIQTTTSPANLVTQAAGQTPEESRAEITELRAELARVRQKLALLAAHDADVTAACRAGLAAVRDGERDPWIYPRGVLAEYGQLPQDDQHPAELLAQTWIRSTQ